MLKIERFFNTLREYVADFNMSARFESSVFNTFRACRCLLHLSPPRHVDAILSLCPSCEQFQIRVHARSSASADV